MENLSTREARLYKALDKLEAVIQHNEADISSWLPLEYELNQTYGYEQTAEFPFLKALRDEMLKDTLAKIENSTIELPADVQNKLYELCAELKKQSPENSNNFSLTLKTVGDVAKILSSITSTVKNLNDLGLGVFLKECLNEIISFLNNMQ